MARQILITNQGPSLKPSLENDTGTAPYIEVCQSVLRPVFTPPVPIQMPALTLSATYRSTPSLAVARVLLEVTGNDLDVRCGPTTKLTAIF